MVGDGHPMVIGGFKSVGRVESLRLIVLISATAGRESFSHGMQLMVPLKKFSSKSCDVEMYSQKILDSNFHKNKNIQHGKEFGNRRVIVYLLL